MAGGESVSASVEGTLTEAFDRAPGESYAVGLEFGTQAGLTVLNALRADQRAWAHGDDCPPALRAQARRKMRAAFAPHDAAWLSAVLARFDTIIDRIETGFLGLK